MAAANGDPRVELSVVTVTPNGLAALENTLAALRAQTARERIELVVVAPSEVSPEDPRLEGFATVKAVAAGEIDNLGQAMAAGVRAATGSVVVYAEEHSWPQPGWAATLIERHREPWAAVGWALENANPESAIGWVHFLADQAPGAAPVASGERRAPLPWHNVSYKRDALMVYGDRLGEMLDTETILHERLLSQGQRLYLEGAATSRHLNATRPVSLIRSLYLGGRGFGAARSRLEAWSARRRLAYALGFPLIPAVRIRRLLPDVRRVIPDPRSRRRLLPLLALGLVVQALGEAVGYLWGSGRSRSQRLTIELERSRHLGSDGAARMEGTGAGPRIAP